MVDLICNPPGDDEEHLKNVESGPSADEDIDNRMEQPKTDPKLYHNH